MDRGATLDFADGNRSAPVMSEGSRLPIFLTTQEVADILRVSKRTLEWWRLEGTGPSFYRFGKGGKARIVYDAEDVKVWVRHKRTDLDF